MLHQGIISESEYAEIDTIMTKKYDLSLDSIFRTGHAYTPFLRASA